MNDVRRLHTAHRKLERCIAEVARLEGHTRGLPDAVVTEWVTVAACHSYDADGDTVAQVVTLLPSSNGGTPYHRLMGLLDYALTRCRAAILTDDTEAVSE